MLVSHSMCLNFAGPGAKSASKRKTLGEQTVLLSNSQDRLVALRRTTAAMQVLLARSVIMKALSLLSIRSVGQGTSEWHIHVSIKDVIKKNTALHY